MLSTLRQQWRSSGQRGSVLSALLIIIAFLAILGGALMNEISGQFLLTQTLTNRIAAEATVNASVESSIAQLETYPPQATCSTDHGVGATSVTLNGVTASSGANCKAIIPDTITQLTPGAFLEDGTHVSGRNTYLVGGGRSLLNFSFDSGIYLWQVALGRTVSAQPNQAPDPSNPGHFMTVVPVGDGVSLVDDSGQGSATLVCTMSAVGAVTAQPAFEHAPAGSRPLFANYVYFGDSSGRLYAYDASTNGGCDQIKTISGLGGPVVAGPLVLTGQQNDDCGDAASNGRRVDLFAIVNAGGSGLLVHYQYCEGTSNARGGGPVRIFEPMPAKSLSLGTPVGAAYSSVIPASGGTIRLAVSAKTGQIGLASIHVSSVDGGLTYSPSAGPVVSLSGSFNKAPYWCHCPAGDRIGAGTANGYFYVLDLGLNGVRYCDKGFQVTTSISNNNGCVGGSAINTTPAADATSGSWYFGADDGIHEVEPVAAGTFATISSVAQAPIQSSPVVGNCGVANQKLCIYFGTGSELDLAQIGDVRVWDLNRVDAGSGPPLWVRVEVGRTLGVHILSWSYFNPPKSP